MHASQKSVNRAQGIGEKNRNDARMNRFRHRGMQKSHIQITPDGKVIQHYVVDSQTATLKKEMKLAYEKAQAKKAQEEATQEPTQDPVNE